VEDIQFVLNKKIIYFQDKINKRLRLCISKALKQKIFESAHNEQAYEEFARIYKRVVSIYYMRNLTRRLKRYLRHCSSCQLNSTIKHHLYKQLKPIVCKSELFHTITIDFILALPKLPNKYDTIMSVIDKFSKRITTIAKKNTFSAEK